MLLVLKTLQHLSNAITLLQTHAASDHSGPVSTECSCLGFGTTSLKSCLYLWLSVSHQSSASANNGIC